MARRDTAKSEQAEDNSADPAPEIAAPIEFHATDRYHAVTHINEALPHVPKEVKARLHAALGTLDHRGPVHVVIPAPEKPDDDAAPHPLAPHDGAFLIKPYHFVKV
jgi:hypothetical protein